MFRRFLALFALHFFLSVGVFAVGDMPGAPAAPEKVELLAAGTTLVQLEESATGSHSSAMKLHADGFQGGLALTDEVPDPPESMPRVLSAPSSQIDGTSAIAYRQRTVAVLSLDGLLRPPHQTELTV